MSTDKESLLVIGARSLIGRRLREAVQAPGVWAGDVRFTSRQKISGQSLILDMAAPGAFQPDARFSTVILCPPIWLVTDALLRRLVDFGMRRLIVFSSTSRFTKGDSGTEAERDVVAKLAAGEKTTIDFCEANGVTWTILRPTLIYDEGEDETVTRIHSLIRKLGFFPICPPGDGLRQPVHARDLARAALQAIPAEAAFDKAYNLSGGESLSYRAMVERIFVTMGRKPAVLAIPEAAWRFAFALINAFQPGRALKRNISMVLRMNRDLWFDHAAASKDFGYAPGPFRPDFSQQ